jgi:hypothetical protein
MKGRDLVAAEVDGAEDDRAIPRPLNDGLVEGRLLVEPRHRFGRHELEFGAEQADALGAHLVQMVEVEGQAGIDQQVDLDPVGRLGRVCRAVARVRPGLLFRQGHAGVEVGDDLGFGPDVDEAPLAIDDHQHRRPRRGSRGR